MSEYQYFEFQALDRRLDEGEMNRLRRISSRARITPTSFVNDYSWGDFKGNPDEWVEKYFDAFLYLANWGTRILQIRLPETLIPAATAALYCPGEWASVRRHSGKLILKFVVEREAGGDWIEGEGILSSLLPIRSDLVRGDLRALYIGWLLCLEQGDLSEDAIEPPVPPNLAELTPGLLRLADFLCVDPDLLSVAAQASPAIESRSPASSEMVAWVASLPTREKDEFLVRVMEDEDPHIGAQLYSRFLREQPPPDPTNRQDRRTVGELRRATEAHAERRRRDEARREAEEQARRAKQAVIARDRHLDALEGNETRLWSEVESLIASRLAKNYERAVQHLKDLRDLAIRHGEQSTFSRKMSALCGAHARKTSLIAKLRSIAE